MATTTRPSAYDHVVEENARYVAAFDRSKLPMRPALKLAVIACFDARITVEDILGLRTGDANIIRNAGGLATDDAMRSLVISHHLLGTDEVIVLAHTGCGMLTFTDADLQDRLTRQTGQRPDLPLLAFDDLEASVRDQVAKIRAHPWTGDMAIHGLVYDVGTGRLDRIDDAVSASASG